MWFRIGCMVLFIWLTVINISGWNYGLMDRLHFEGTPGTTKFHITYRTGFFWWAFHVIALFTNTFFLFLGLFYLPLVVGVW